MAGKQRVHIDVVHTFREEDRRLFYLLRFTIQYAALGCLAYPEVICPPVLIQFCVPES